MAPKVFKIPDGNGGILYQIQTPDGQWHDTDEAGNILPKDSAQVEIVSEVAPVRMAAKERGKEKTSLPSKGSSHVNFSIQFSKEEYKEFSDYIHWRCLFKENCSKASFLLRLAIEAVRKDKGYQEFKRKNP